MVFINDLLDSDFELSYKLVSGKRDDKGFLRGEGTLFYRNKLIEDKCDVRVHSNGNGYVYFENEKAEMFCMEVLSMVNFKEVDKRIKLRTSLFCLSMLLNIAFTILVLYSGINLFISFGTDDFIKYALCCLFAFMIRLCSLGIKKSVMDVGVKDSAYTLRQIEDRYFFIKNAEKVS